MLIAKEMVLSETVPAVLYWPSSCSVVPGISQPQSWRSTGVLSVLSAYSVTNPPSADSSSLFQ